MHKSFENSEKLISFYSQVVDALPKDYGYSKTIKSSVKLLDKENALVSNIFARYKKDESEYYRAAALYLLKKIERKWKMIGLIEYDLNNYLDFP